MRIRSIYLWLILIVSLIFTNRAMAQSVHWESASANGAAVKEIVAAPDNPAVFYAAADNLGIYKSTDQG